MSKTTVLHIVSLFMGLWKCRIEILPISSRTTEHGIIISSLSRYEFLGTKQLTTTTYDLERNGQAERFNKKLMVRLRHYVAEYQRDWDIDIQPFRLTYNNQVPRSTNLTPFSLILPRQLIGLKIFDNQTAVPTDPTVTTPSHALQARMLHRVARMTPDADRRMKSLQQRYKDDHDEKWPMRHCHSPPDNTFI